MILTPEYIAETTDTLTRFTPTLGQIKRVLGCITATYFNLQVCYGYGGIPLSRDTSFWWGYHGGYPKIELRNGIVALDSNLQTLVTPKTAGGEIAGGGTYQIRPASGETWITDLIVVDGTGSAVRLRTSSLVSADGKTGWGSSHHRIPLTYDYYLEIAATNPSYKVGFYLSATLVNQLSSRTVFGLQSVANGGYLNIRPPSGRYWLITGLFGGTSQLQWYNGSSWVTLTSANILSGAVGAISYDKYLRFYNNTGATIVAGYTGFDVT